MLKLTIFIKLFFQIHIEFFKQELKEIYSRILLFKKSQKKRNYISTSLNDYMWKSNTSKKILITSFLNLPEYLIYEYLVGLYVSNLLKLNVLILIRKNDSKTKRFFENLGLNNLIYYEEVNLFLRYFNLLKSFKLIVFKDVDEFLKIRIKGLPIGKFVYSHYVRFSGLPTINKVNSALIYLFSKYFNSYYPIKKILKNNNIKHLIQSETQFIPAAVCYGLSLSKRINVYSRCGVQKITIRKVNKINHIFENILDFDKGIIKKLSKEKRRNFFLKKGFDLIKGRFEDKSIAKLSNIDDQQFRYYKNKKIKFVKYYNKLILCKLFNWDIKKPIGLILANDLTDGLFLAKTEIFRDNYTWLISTINEAKKNKKINWIIKPHPREIKNKVKMTTKSFVNRINETNIKLLPENFSSKPLIKIVDVVFTDHGSAGYEYPALGVPAVTTTKTLYSDLNITTEIETKKKYFALIKNIHKNYKNLSISKENACLFAFLYESFSRTKCIAPDLIKFGYNVENQDCWKLIEKSFGNFKKKNVKNLKNDKLYQALKLQLEKNNKHTLNFDLLNIMKNNY